jgi:cardiolipin synthase
MKLRYIPNLLTLIRIISVFPFLICLSAHEYRIAFYIFFFAGFTDGLDGWLARHFDWQSQLGSILDPMADKLLVVSSFISLALLQQLPWWLVALVILRDFSICVGVIVWLYWIHPKLDFEPTRLSKINTIFQLSLVTLCLFQLSFVEVPRIFFDPLVLSTALLTSASYIHYVWIGVHRACLKKKIPHPG